MIWHRHCYSVMAGNLTSCKGITELERRAESVAHNLLGYANDIERETVAIFIIYIMDH